MTFVDTSFWVALGFRRDDHHLEAGRLWSRRPSGLVTSNHVVGETWTFLRRRVGHPAAIAFLDRVKRSQLLAVVHVDVALEAEAFAWLRRHDERTYSFADATSFVVMRRSRISDALAFDGEFSAAGYHELRAPASP